MPADILARIVADRRARIANEGAAQGIQLPIARPKSLPISPFPSSVICEVKRRSPSRGSISADLDPVAQARRYYDAGVRSVSVLTEQDHFAGSLKDLVAIKHEFPDLAVLRKDFLVIPEDVEVSWRAGADAILIIVSILSRAEISALLAAARRRGLAALVEVHDRDDVDRIRDLAPELLGINARDLTTFRVDLFDPPGLAGAIDWPCRRVFESGIFHREDAELARGAKFDAVLVGEAVVKRPLLAGELVEAMSAERSSDGGERFDFWARLARAREQYRVTGRSARPLVKICGITNRPDARLAVGLGADLLGLIYAESPRTAEPGLARQLRQEVDVPLVAVVVEPADHSDEYLERAQQDLAAGVIDAIQLHGNVEPAAARSVAATYYKAVRPENAEAATNEATRWRSPRVLLDAYDPRVAGGTGSPVNSEVLAAWREALNDAPHGELWLAGGLSPDNIAEVISSARPELIDASSRLESQPGHKDPSKLRQFFVEIERAAKEAS